MRPTIEAEYLASENILRLAQPLAGVADHARIWIEIKETCDQPWLALAGSLSEKKAESSRAPCATHSEETRSMFDSSATRASYEMLSS